MTHNEKMKEMGLQGELLRIKNEQYNEIDRLIWDKKKEFSDWESRFDAIHAAFKQMIMKMALEIDKYLD